VKLDSTERADIPPFGGRIDYLTFGGIYRDVRLRVVPKTFLANVFARPVRVMEPERGLEVRCWLDGPVAAGAKLAVELRDGNRVLSTGQAPVETPAADITKSPSIVPATSNSGISSIPSCTRCG
jgi:beta-galactosidase